MTDPKIETTITGGQIRGVEGSGSIIIENLTVYNRPVEKPATVGDEAISPCPYPGLAYFGPGNAGLFFGRDAAIGRLVKAVNRQSVTALVGASGSGKSSLVLAGLAPHLHRAGDHWLFTHFRIGTEVDKDPFLAIARALVPLYVARDNDTERLRNTRLLGEGLRAGELALRDVLSDCRSRNKGKRILLIADQFEEAFTLVEDDKVRDRFLDVLLAGFSDRARGAGPNICLILTLRADFYGRALRYGPLADALQGHVENLGPMNRKELQAAISRPAARAKVSFDAGLVKTLLDDVESKPGSLPLLQFALREMWGRQEKRRIKRKIYDDIEGVGGALAQRAEAILVKLTQAGAKPEMEKAFRRLFTRLVTLGEGQADTRRVVEHRELGDDVWALAQRLAGEDNRLVVTNAPDASHETAELVHEALICHWPKLVEWVDRDRTFQSWLRQIKSNVDMWSADRPDEGPLLRGSMLAQGADWLNLRANDCSPAERGYIEASLALNQRERDAKEAKQQAKVRDAQRLAAANRRIATRTSVGAVAALVLALVAGWQWHSAKIQHDRADNTIRDLSVSYGKLGDAQVAQGDLPAALTSYVSRVAIIEGLAKSDPGNTLWWHELPVSYNKVGDMQVAQGDLGAALTAYQAGLASAERLAGAEPRNAGWQHDLSISYEKIGDVEVAQRDLSAALKSYQASLAIRERLARFDPRHADWQRDLSASYVKIGDVQVAQSNLPAALKSYEASRAIAERLAESNPGSTGWQHDLSVSYEKVGDVQAVQGNLPAALSSYQASLAISERLTKSDPRNAGLQRDLSVSYGRIGDAQVAQGDLPAALRAYQAGLASAQRLAESNPGNTGWQRELSVSYEKVGDVQAVQGNLPAALSSYQASLAIRERLAKADPGNAGWQRDLSVSYEKVGNVQAAQGDLPAALSPYQASLAISERLAESNPGNTGWQRDLSVSYERIGDAQVAQGDLPAALSSYQANLAIRERLAKSDPGNAGWQRDLSVSYEKVGDVQVAQGDPAAALTSYQASLAIAERLAKSNPGNSGWQRHLSISYEKIGDVQVAQGDLSAALASYQADLGITGRLAKSDPGNAGWQRDLSGSYARLAYTYRAAGQPTKARKALDAGRTIIARLVAQFPDHADWKQDLAWFDRQIADLQK